MGSTKRKHAKVPKYIKENQSNENILQSSVEDAFYERKPNFFRIASKKTRLKKCSTQQSDFHMKSSFKRPKRATPQWTERSSFPQQTVFKAENTSPLNDVGHGWNPCANTPVIYKPLDAITKKDPDSFQSSAAWSPFIQMRRIDLIVCSGRPKYLTKETARDTKKHFSNSFCRQSARESVSKFTNTKLASHTLLQPIVRLKRMDIKPSMQLSNVLVRNSTKQAPKSAQSKEIRWNPIRNDITDRTLRSSRQSTFQLVQNKIMTRRSRMELQLKNQGKIQDRNINNLNHLFPKPLKREPADLIASRTFKNESVRTLPRPIRVKREQNLQKIQPIVKLQRFNFLQKENRIKEKTVKKEPSTRTIKPIVKLQRLDLSRGKIIKQSSSESVINTLKSKAKPNQVQLQANIAKKLQAQKPKHFNFLQKENKNKSIRESIPPAFKSMQPKVKLKRFKIPHGKTGNEYSAVQLKAQANSAPFLRLKRLELKYFLQLTSGRFLLSDTYLKYLKKQKNLLKFKPIQVKQEEFSKFDYLIESQQMYNCEIIEIKQEEDSCLEQSRSIFIPIQSLPNSSSSVRSSLNTQLKRPNMRKSILKKVNAKNNNFVSIKTEPDFESEN